jgi:uncharacterized protein YceH (UPF0502 family)
MQLEPLECRVLGVMIEKAQTVQSQYPLTLNALLSGCNQRNNRQPVLSVEEDDVLHALDHLRGKGLAREVMMSGSRVPKFKHDARDGLSVGTSGLVILAELLLRGPQTVGELRTRASRMHPLESVDVVEAVLSDLAGRDEPMVRRIGPAPGGRADRWVQLLCPDLHPLNEGGAAGAAAPASAPAAAGAAAAPHAAPADDGRVDELERRIAALEAVVRRLATSLGEDAGELPAASSENDAP